MAIKTYRPTTQTLRYRTTLVNDDITSTQPHKPLLEPKPRTGGRRNSGQTTMWFIGGGHKRKLRIIDFKRDKIGIPATCGFDRIRSQPLGAHRFVELMPMARSATSCSPTVEGWTKSC